MEVGSYSCVLCWTLCSPLACAHSFSGVTSRWRRTSRPSTRSWRRRGASSRRTAPTGRPSSASWSSRSWMPPGQDHCPCSHGDFIVIVCHSLLSLSVCPSRSGPLPCSHGYFVVIVVSSIHRCNGCSSGRLFSREFSWNWPGCNWLTWCWPWWWQWPWSIFTFDI